MYHNQSAIRKVTFALGPTLLLVSIAVIIAGIYYYTKYRRDQVVKIQTETDRYARYIYDYAASISDDRDDVVDLTIKAFKWDKSILSVKGQTASGEPIPNYTWDMDSEAFLAVIMMIQDALVCTSKKKSRHYKNEVIWSMAIFFVKQVMTIMPTRVSANTVPWGKNWYQFSITFPRFLTIASYLYDRIYEKPNDYLKRTLSIYISGYFDSPDDVVGVKSMGWLREGANAIMMAVPYIGGRLLMQTYNDGDTIVKYAKNYVSLEEVTSGEGLYPDGGFVFHGSLRAYGYIYSSYEDFKLLSQFFYKSVDRIERIFEIFEHPTIPLHFSGFFTRAGTLGSSSARGKMGLFVVDSIKAVIAKTPNWYLSFNGQKKDLCYYEADQANNAWGQAWIGARQFLYADSEKRWHQQLVTYYPGVISYANAHEVMPSTTTTTQTHMPNFARTMIVKAPGAIGIRNEYRITFNSYELDVVEMMLITAASGYHVFYKIKPNITRHSSEPITVSVNLGRMITGASTVGRGTGYKFEKNYSFIYNDTKDIKTTSVEHPKDNITLTSVQIVPEIDADDFATVAFSNIHSETNDCLEIPTEASIKTDAYVLTWDKLEPYTLFLTDEIRKNVTVTQFEDNYSEIVNIPTKVITKRYGAKALEGKIVIGPNVSASTHDNGNQITFNIK